MRNARRTGAGIAAAMLSLLAAPGSAANRTNYDRNSTAVAQSASASVIAAAKAPGLVSSRDAATGRATFIWSAGPGRTAGPAASAEQAARKYLAQHAAHYGVGRSSLDSLVLRRIHDTGRGGILAIFGQRVGGIDVDAARVTVVMKRNLDLVAIGGSMVPTGAATKGDGTSAAAFVRGEEDALDSAFHDLFGGDSRGAWRRDGARNGATTWSLLPSTETLSGISLWAPSRVWTVWYAAAEGLVPAYKLEILANDAHGDASYAYLVSARDGEILRRTSLQDDVHSYRVWSGSDQYDTPLDGPIADLTPHPTGIPDGTQISYIPSALTALGEFNVTLDPWLAAGAVQTLGNNVDAYADINAPDGYSNGDLRAVTTSADTFDYTYDTASAAGVDEEQTMAGVTHLFYMNNWLHDFYYDSGFDETAGNAQTSNYGRGGEDGDAIHAESDDSSGSNNANMNTPSDGISPRMQMYTWTGPSIRYVRRTSAPGQLDFNHGLANYGLTTYDVTAEMVRMDDGESSDFPPNGSIRDGCTLSPNDYTGKIVLIDRGNCNFVQKSGLAAQKGAVAVIIANIPTSGSPTVPPTMGGPCVIAECNNIASVSLNVADGDILRNNAVNDAPVQMVIHRATDPIRSGGIDSGIIAHEWGHYFHHRLQNCGSDQCRGQSEGWGDFIGLHMTVEEGDNYDGGVYATGSYVTAQFSNDSPYFGIRRYPYSTDFNKNALTFHHISQGQALPVGPPISPAGWQNNGNNEVHNAGEIWTSMLFQAYVALLTDPAPAASPDGATPRLTFDEARRRMGDYIVAGLQITPVDSTYTETRDGILAAAFAGDPLDYDAMVNAFAVRGAGSCAVSPERYSSTFTGVVEDYDLGGRMAATEATFDDDVVSCDNDGYLDAPESGTIRVTVTSLSPTTLTGTVVSATSSNPHVTFPNGNSVNVDDLEFGESAEVGIVVAADATTDPMSSVTIEVTTENPDTCETEIVSSRVLDLAVNEESSKLDDVETLQTSWTETGDSDLWTRTDDAGNRVWHGPDSGFVTDTRLVSAPLHVNPTGNFVIEFDHSYDFEGDPSTWWDGGVVEFSTNGSTWFDVSTQVAVAYDGVLTGISGNPLAGRQAYSGQNASFPSADHVTFDFGTYFAGQTVQFRFRIGTDGGAGMSGWDIDNIEVTNTSNSPFFRFVADSPICAAGELFVDGFESGDTSAWSN